MIERVGRATIELGSEARALLVFYGMTIASYFAVLRRPRDIRIVSLVNQIEQTGLNAIPIVCLLSIFGLETLASAVSFFSHPLEVMLNSLMLVVSGSAFGLWLILLIRSFQGIAIKLPIIGDEAARRVWGD